MGSFVWGMGGNFKVGDLMVRGDNELLYVEACNRLKK